jgi:hypothetical protein
MSENAMDFTNSSGSELSLEHVGASALTHLRLVFNGEPETGNGERFFRNKS